MHNVDFKFGNLRKIGQITKPKLCQSFHYTVKENLCGKSIVAACHMCLSYNDTYAFTAGRVLIMNCEYFPTFTINRFKHVRVCILV